jgi:hypothetical protein
MGGRNAVETYLVDFRRDAVRVQLPPAALSRACRAIPETSRAPPYLGVSESTNARAAGASQAARGARVQTTLARALTNAPPDKNPVHVLRSAVPSHHWS